MLDDLAGANGLGVTRLISGCFVGWYGIAFW